MEKDQAGIQALKSAIKNTWPGTPSVKARGYIGQFFDRKRTGKKIVAKVEGNYGTYTVSLESAPDFVHAACSCYKGGFCHHSEALGYTFLQDEESFQAIKKKTLKQVRTPEDIAAYLKMTTLESLMQQLKKQGITQKEFAEMIGMNQRHLSAVKSSELKNRFFHELGATKLACLWVLEHLK